MRLDVRRLSRDFVGYLCFMIFWIILMVGKGLGYSSNTDGFINFVLVGGLFPVICLTQKKWTKQRLFYFLLFIILGLCIWLFSGNKDAILSFLVIFCVAGFDIENIIKITLLIRGGFFFVKSVGGIFGVLDKGVYYSYHEGISRTRYMFGYVQPNTAHYEFFIVCVLIILIFKNKLKWFHYGALFAFNILFYTYTNSRTGVVLSAFLLLGSFVISKNTKLATKLLGKWTKRYYLVIVALSFIICYLVSNGFLLGYGTLSSRFTTALRVITSYPLSLFGVPDAKTDFGFIYMLYANGILFLIAYIILNVKLAKELKKKYLIQELLILFVYGLYTLFESYSSSILMNMSLLYVSWLFVKAKDKREEAQSTVKVS